MLSTPVPLQCPGCQQAHSCTEPTMVPRPARAVGGAERGGNERSTTKYLLMCPAGSLVTGMTVLHKPFVYSLGPLTCSDGTVAPGGSTNPLITAGTAANYAPSSYITGFPAVYTGSYIGGLVIRSSTGQDITFGTPGGWGGDVTVQPATMCPAGSFLAGLYGKTSGTAVVSIAPVCRAAGELAIMQQWLLAANMPIHDYAHMHATV